jgi:hypothetical protein
MKKYKYKALKQEHLHQYKKMLLEQIELDLNIHMWDNLSCLQKRSITRNSRTSMDLQEILHCSKERLNDAFYIIDDEYETGFLYITLIVSNGQYTCNRYPIYIMDLHSLLPTEESYLQIELSDETKKEFTKRFAHRMLDRRESFQFIL